MSRQELMNLLWGSDKIKPILFSTPMVQAILKGKKTQTRQKIKPHKNLHGGVEADTEKLIYINWDANGNELHQKPKHKIGDILWVREAWSDYDNQANYYIYRADYDKAATGFWYEEEQINWCPFPKWKSPIIMPKDAARIFLEITNVRIEQLQDISEEDAVKEGIYAKPGSVSGTRWYRKFITESEARIEGLFTKSAKECYQTLWESIHGKESWDYNPYVWVYEFKTIKRLTK